MSINASARKYRVWVCRPGQDKTNGFEVTEYCSGESSGFFVATSQPLDESGLIKIQGTLNLQVPPYNNGFDPWENPNQWAIGNHVYIEVADERGTLRPLPLNHLYILSEPPPPYPGHWVLSLELGDRMTLEDGRYPAKSSSNGDEKSRTATLSELLGQLNDGFDGATPTGKALSGYQPDTSKSIVSQAGELALGAYTALRHTTAGHITTTRINLLPDQRLFKHVVGVDDAGDYQPLQSAQRPPSEVEVISEKSDVPSDSDDSESDAVSGGVGQSKLGGSRTTKTNMSRSTISEGTGNGETLAIIRKETWAWSGAQHKETVEETRCRGLTIPQDLYDALAKAGVNLINNGPFALITALISTQNKFYESSSEGRLLRIEKTCQAPLGQVLAEFYKKYPPQSGTAPNFDQLIDSELEVTEYFYQAEEQQGKKKDSKGQVRKIRVTKSKPRGQIAGSANDWRTSGISSITQDPRPMAVYEVSEQSWHKRSKKEWDHHERILQAGQIKSGSIAAFLRLATVKDETTASLAGDIQPPAAERRPSTRRKPSSNNAPKGSAKFSGSSGSGDRKKTVQIDHLEDEANARQLAKLWGDIYKARHRGFRITTALRDEWFTWKPLSRLDLEYNGYVYWGITDLVTFTLAGNQAIVLADCMRVGRVDAAQHGPDSYPYAPLPPLLPGDPDPQPFPEPSPDELYPERLNTQPFIPIHQVFYPFIIESLSEAEWSFLPLGTAPQPTRNLTIDAIAQVLIYRLAAFESLREVVITFLPVLVVNSLRQVVITALSTEPGLISEWKLDTEAWEDSVGGNNLTNIFYYFGPGGPGFATDVSLAVGADGGDNCAEFGDGGYLSVYCDSDSNLLTRPDAEHLWSWRLSLRLWLPTVTEALRLVQDQNDWSLDIYNRSDGNFLGFALYGYDGQIGGVVSTVDLAAETWYEVRCDFNAITGLLSISVNGTLTTNPADIDMEYLAGNTSNSGRWFRLGSGYPEGVRMSKVKFYLLETRP
jgi:hypothetical protein